MNNQTIFDDILTDALTVFLAESHIDLFNAEQEEDFEKCNVIKTGMLLTLNNAAELLAFRTGYTPNSCLGLLNQINDSIHYHFRGAGLAPIIFEDI